MAGNHWKNYPGLEYYEETGLFKEDWIKLSDEQKKRVWKDLKNNRSLELD